MPSCGLELQILRAYLQSEHSMVRLDQASLPWFVGITELFEEKMRGRLPLSEFSFDIVYKKGNCNT